MVDSVNFFGFYITNNTKHPNRVPFMGVLTTLDKPSGSPVSGTRNNHLILPTDVAKASLDSLLGMAVNYKTNWKGHCYTRKCALITKAEIDQDKLLVSGFIYASDFPKVVPEIQKGRVGMSYEICKWNYEKVSDKVLRITEVIFSGASFLHKTAAAYRNTKVKLL